MRKVLVDFPKGAGAMGPDGGFRFAGPVVWTVWLKQFWHQEFFESLQGWADGSLEMEGEKGQGDLVVVVAA